MLPSPDQNLKIGSVGRDFFFFFFFFTYRERVEFSNIFFTVSKWGQTRAECSQNAYTSHASAFLSHWIQILANSSPKSDIKKKPTLFFRILRSVGRGQHNTFFFLALYGTINSLLHVSLGIPWWRFHWIKEANRSQQPWFFTLLTIHYLCKSAMSSNNFFSDTNVCGGLLYIFQCDGSSIGLTKIHKSKQSRSEDYSLLGSSCVQSNMVDRIQRSALMMYT